MEAGPILVAGGGIAGLAAALALQRAGRAVEVLERSPDTSAAGAGIQLGPNAVKVLRALGIGDAVEHVASTPEALLLRHGVSGRLLSRLELGDTIAARHGAPYWVVHRADLLAALRAGAAAVSIPVQMGCEVDRFESAAGDAGVTVELRDGERRSGVALVGADGVWSRVRACLVPEFQPRMSGYSAYRTLIPATEAGVLGQPVVGAWLSPSVHVVHYPVSCGREINVVVVVRDGADDRDWSARAEPATVGALLAGLARPLRDALAPASAWHKWSLPWPVDVPLWHRGPVALVGDAAHATLPFFAQGGVMALEDASVLAAAVAANGTEMPRAFVAFEAHRRARVARIQAASTANGQIFHLSGLPALARDTTLQLMPQRLLQARFDWLYGYAVDATRVTGVP